MISNGVEVEIPGEDGDGGSSSNEGSEDVGFRSKVEDGDLDVSVGIEGVGMRSADLGDEIFDGGIPVVRSLRYDVVSFSDGELRQRRSIVSEKGGDGSSIDSRDSWYTMTMTPFVETLDGEVVGVAFREITDDDSGALDSVTFEERRRSVELAEGVVVRYSVISYQRRGAASNERESASQTRETPDLVDGTRRVRESD